MARTRSGVVLGGTAAPAVAPAANGTAPTSARPRVGGLAGGLSSLGARGYLYLLVLIEVGLIAGLRYCFRDNHGG